MLRTSFMISLVGLSTVAFAADPNGISQEPNSWVKRSPLATAPLSPNMGYETTLAYDPVARRVIRWGGHNQGGGGEQNAELWLLDPLTMKWELREPNTSPPGVCCGQQNLFDPSHGRFLRFGAFSGNHGWQSFREISLSNSSVWNYDVATNTWRDMRPHPAPVTAPLRCASWDSDQNVAVVFGGEGSSEGTIVYDPHTNEWTRMKPKSQQPEFRSGGNMAYDAANKLHILFGAQFMNDLHTWAYDLKRNEWRDLRPAVQPPTDRNDAMLTYDAAGRVIVAVVRAIDKTDEKNPQEVTEGHLETWTFDSARNVWTKRNPAREPDGWGNRRRCITAVPDLNVCLMEAWISPQEKLPGVEREQQIWTYRLTDSNPGARDDKPGAPNPSARKQPWIVEDVTVSVRSAREIHIAWKPPTGDASELRYVVERAGVEVYSDDQLNRVRDQCPPHYEPSVGAVKAIGTFQRLTAEPLAALTFADSGVDLTKKEPLGDDATPPRQFHKDQLHADGKPYRFAVFAYRVRAVNALGMTSGPSPYFLTIPSAPQWLFSKEDGTNCHMRWSANLEQDVKGYRVYRMGGPNDLGKWGIARLTESPIAATQFTDPEAGKNAARYWVTAVDALGQEGIPSAPTWHNRIYQRYYTPFVGEWHQ